MSSTRIIAIVLIVAGGLMLARVWVLRRRAARSAPR